jgi:hypothetical protein
MQGMHVKAASRYMIIVTGMCLSLFVMVEFTGWLIVPDRYRNPPPVTADAWIYSDALSKTDTVWLKEFVDEFCRSYAARWTSYLYFRREPFSGRHINVDSNGHRCTLQFQEDQRDGRRNRRVFLLGGSTMWGTGARDSNTIPSALARLNASEPEGRRTHMLNMGESGYVNTQSLFALELELRRGNVPDDVIFYDGVNDIFSTYQNNEAGLPQNEQNRVLEFNLLQNGGRMRELGIRDLWNRTVTVGVVARIRDIISPSPPAPAAHIDLAGDVVQLYRGNLEILGALSRHYGFRYRAYWQPVVFSKRDPSPYEREQSKKMEHVRRFYQEVYRLVDTDSVLRANPCFHNLSGIFDGVGPVYLDFCHITERGNGIVARQMYEDLYKR